MTIIHRFMLDLNEQTTMEYVSVRKNEVGQQIRVTLRAGGKPFDVSGVSVAILSIKLPNGSRINITGTKDGSELVADLTSAATAAVGELKCCFNLIGTDGNVLTSPPFTIIVNEPASALN